MVKEYKDGIAVLKNGISLRVRATELTVDESRAYFWDYNDLVLVVNMSEASVVLFSHIDESVIQSFAKERENNGRTEETAEQDKS